ncbi:MAG: hypothetical protein M3463_08055 [Verrucomicrobiota bacterium]|nr:hypothetical protein [Verrucomicrobiota bacterium]
MKRRYPAAAAWLEPSLGKGWDRSLSFLGFVWVQTCLDSAGPPTTRAELTHFLERCAATAGEFRQKTSKRLSSEVQVTGSQSLLDDR